MGVTFTSNLKWSRHIQIVCSNAFKKLGLLRRHSGQLDRQSKETVFLNVIRLALEYASIIYNNCNIADSNKLDQVQRRAAIICLKAHARTETSKLLAELNGSH